MKEIRRRLREKLLSEEFQGAQRMRETDFTRKQKLGFTEIFVVMLKSAKRGLHTAVKEVAESVRFEVKSYTEMAFFKARQKMNWTAFEEISFLTAEAFYDAARKARRWRNLRVWGIDGSKINLPTNPATLAEFGSERYADGLKAQGLASRLIRRAQRRHAPRRSGAFRRQRTGFGRRTLAETGAVLQGKGAQSGAGTAHDGQGVSLGSADSTGAGSGIFYPATGQSTAFLERAAQSQRK